MQQELQVVSYICVYVVYLVASVAHEVPVIPWSHPFFVWSMTGNFVFGFLTFCPSNSLSLDCLKLLHARNASMEF